MLVVVVDDVVVLLEVVVLEEVVLDEVVLEEVVLEEVGSYVESHPAYGTHPLPLGQPSK